MPTCASCGTNNVEGTKFCVSCGAALAPSPGAWRSPTDELRGQPSSGGASQSGSPGVSYPPSPSMPPTYAPPATAAPGSMFGMPSGGDMSFTTMRYAEWIDRVAAALIDGFLTAAVAIVMIIIISIVAGGLGAVGGEGAATGILCLGMGITMLSALGLGLYNKVFLVSKRGFSIGQGIMKLKVVDASGNIPSVGTLILRLLVQLGMNAVPFVGIILILLDLLWPLWDEKKQTLHDKAASTFVIKTA